MKAKYINIVIRLGKTQSFEIFVDSRVTLAKPDKDTPYASNVSGSSDALLVEVFTKVASGFGTTESLDATVSNGTITGFP